MIPVSERLRQIQDRFSGILSVYAEHLGTGEKVALGPVTPMETASTIKLAILLEAFRQVDAGILGVSQPVSMIPADDVQGSGILQHLSRGLVLPLLDLLTLMIIVSDNVATNAILRLVGIEAVNTSLHQWGFRQTVLKKRIDFSSPGPIGLSTPEDLAGLMKGIYHNRLVSRESSARAWAILTRQQFTMLIRYLPYHLITGSDDPPTVVIGSKSGSLEGVRNDVGLVKSPWGDYVVAVMTRDCRDRRFHVDNEAQQLIPQISRAVFDHFLPEACAPNHA